MEKKQLAILLLASLIPLIFFCIRGTPIGYDGYAYASSGFYGVTLPEHTPLFFSWIIENLAKNFQAYAFIIWLCFVSNILLISKLGELFDKKNGWMAGLFSFYAIGFTLLSFEFDRMALAFPLITLGYYFYFKEETNFFSKSIERILSVIIFGFTLLFVWNGTIIPIIALSLTSFIFFIPAAIILILKLEQFISSITPSFLIGEQKPLVGLLNLMVLNLGMLNIPKKLVYPTIVLFVFALLQSKFSTLLIPFFSIGCVLLYSKLESFKTNKFVFGQELNEFKKQFMLISIAILLVGFSYAILDFYPKQYEKDAVLYSIQVAQQANKPLKNDWSYGYFIEFFSKGNVVPSAKGGFGLEQDYNNSNAIVLTEQDTNCILLKRFEKIGVYSCPAFLKICQEFVSGEVYGC